MLEVRDLVVRYGRLQVLHGVSLSVSEGDFVAVLGRNGAGKSSLVHAVAGLVRPASGSIVYRGERIDGKPAPAIVRRGLAVVLEGRQLFPDLSVEDNLRLGGFGRLTSSRRGWLAALGRGAADLDRGLERVFGVFPQLRRLAHRPAGLLSGGEQQMVAIGRALMAEPELLVIDELSLGLAPRVVMEIAEHLQALHAQGMAIVLIEQSVGLSLKLARHAYVLDSGVVRASGRAAELATQTSVLEAYLGAREAIQR